MEGKGRKEGREEGRNGKIDEERRKGGKEGKIGCEVVRGRREGGRGRWMRERGRGERRREGWIEGGWEGIRTSAVVLISASSPVKSFRLSSMSASEHPPSQSCFSSSLHVCISVQEGE